MDSKGGRSLSIARSSRAMTTRGVFEGQQQSGVARDRIGPIGGQGNYRASGSPCIGARSGPQQTHARHPSSGRTSRATPPSSRAGGGCSFVVGLPAGSMPDASPSGMGEAPAKSSGRVLGSNRWRAFSSSTRSDRVRRRARSPCRGGVMGNGAVERAGANQSPTSGIPLSRVRQVHGARHRRTACPGTVGIFRA